jgi:hypothetical protein
MKKLIVSLFAASMLASGSGALVATGAMAQTVCGPDAPASWYNPGGFCAQVGGTGSLTNLGDSDGTPCIEPEVVLVEDYLLSAVQELEVGERIHVAQVYCDDGPSLE